MFCDNNSVGTLGFSPLCQGYLTGKYASGIPIDSRIAKSDKLDYHKTANFYQQNKERIDYFKHFSSIIKNAEVHSYNKRLVNSQKQALDYLANLYSISVDYRHSLNESAFSLYRGQIREYGCI